MDDSLTALMVDEQTTKEVKWLIVVIVEVNYPVFVDVALF